MVVDTEAAKKRLADLDAALAALEPLEQDAEIAVIVQRKPAERTQIVEDIRAAKPLAVRWRRALEKRKKLVKQADGIREEIALLKDSLMNRHQALREVKGQQETEEREIELLDQLRKHAAAGGACGFNGRGERRPC